MQTTSPSDSPVVTPPDAAKGRTGFLAKSRSLVAHSCRRLWATLWCEFLLQIQSTVFWAMLAVLIILTGFHAWGEVSSGSNYVSPGNAAVEIESYLASFLLFLLPFLYANIFTRDRFRNTQPLIWSRPLTLWEYATGKGLGAITSSLALTWIPLVIGWLITSIVRGSLQPLQIWLGIALLLGAMVAMLTGVALLFIAVTSPLGLLGALLIAIPMTYLNVTSAKSMLWIQDIAGQTLFASASIGFGPDGALLLWQRLCYLAIGIACLALAILFIQLRERLGVVRWYHVICTLLAIAILATSALNSIATFQAIGASYADTGLMTAAPAQAKTSTYKLNVHVDPASAQVHGTASFRLTAQSSTLHALVIELNPGLHVLQASAQDAAKDKTLTLPSTQISAGWTRLDLSQATLATGKSEQISLSYAGTLLYSRDDYAQATGGFGFQHTDQTAEWEQNYWYLNYLGQSAGVLLGAAGSWYPLPYTQQALQTGTRIPVDQLQVGIPNGYKVWSGLAQEQWSQQGSEQILTAQPRKSLPVALLAALQRPQQNADKIWFQGSAPDSLQLQADRFIIKDEQALTTWLQPGSNSSAQVVVVPILPFPVVGDHLLLLPENDFTTPYASNGIVGNSELDVAHAMADRMAKSWWLNTDYFSFTSMHGDSDTQNSTESTSLQPENALLDMLGEYSSVVTMDRILGNNFYNQEMSVCTKLYTLDMAGTPQNDRTYMATEQQELSLGTQCDSMELVPDKLAQAKGVGSAGLTSFLQRYAQEHEQQPTDMRQFLQEADKLAGKDITGEAAPYICPAYNTKVGYDKAHPLSCLDTEYSGT